MTSELKRLLELHGVLAGYFITVMTTILVGNFADASTDGVGSCYIAPSCSGNAIGLMTYATCINAGGGAGSWSNQDGSGCYDTHGTIDGVGNCYISPSCAGDSIGLMPYDTCINAGGSTGSWSNQDGSGCRDTH